MRAFASRLEALLATYILLVHLRQYVRETHAFVIATSVARLAAEICIGAK